MRIADNDASCLEFEALNKCKLIWFLWWVQVRNPLCRQLLIKTNYLLGPGQRPRFGSCPRGSHSLVGKVGKCACASCQKWGVPGWSECTRPGGAGTPGHVPPPSPWQRGTGVFSLRQGNLRDFLKSTALKRTFPCKLDFNKFRGLIEWALSSWFILFHFIFYSDLRFF